MLKFIVSSTGKLGSTKDIAQPMKDLEPSIKSRSEKIEQMSMGRLAKKLSRTFRFEQGGQQELVGRDDTSK